MICTLWLILLVISEWVRIFVHGAKKQQSLCAAALHKSVFKSLLNCTSEISMIMLCVCARAYTYCVRVCVCVSPTPQKNPWRRQYFPEVRPSVVRLSTAAYVHLSVRKSESDFELVYLRNAWTYFNDTYHGYSISGPLDADDFQSHGIKSQGQAATA